MKKLIAILSLIFPVIAVCQTFSSPESVEYDVVNSRWMVGQNGSGEIHSYDPSSGVLTSFATGIPSGPHGIEILGSTLYCCDGAFIKGFDLATGSQIFNVSLGATFLNGLTTDGGHFLFATDFTGKKIYRLNVLTSAFNVMASTTKTPNGIIYDGTHNRCVFVTWGTNAPVQAMSMSDSVISTLKTTSLGNCDGITRDPEGNWYVSSWGNTLNKFDSAFTTGPTVVMSGLTSPADLGINASGDSVGIPNSGSANNIVFYHIPLTTGINNNIEKNSVQVFPNPSSDKITVTLETPVVDGMIELTNLSGQMIVSKKVSGVVFFLDRGNIASGNYLISVKDQGGKIVHSQKVIFN